MAKHTLTRAFELAPRCSSTRELRRLLQAEGCSDVTEHLSGLGTQRQLRALFNGGAGQRKRGPQPQRQQEQCR
jgi:hypothetical protein